MKRAKVFCLGLSRTGTTTLTHFLNDTLGYDHIHYPTIDQLFDPNNDGCSDINVIPHFIELDKKFPGSKWILTVRDKEEWLNSMEQYLSPKRTFKAKMSKAAMDLRMAVYGSIRFDREQFCKAFDQHHEKVINYFVGRATDFLMLNIIDGEKPQSLYDFLGIKDQKGLPTEFPWKNKLKN